MHLCCFLLSYHVFWGKATSALAVTVQFSAFPLPFSRDVLIMIYIKKMRREDATKRRRVAKSYRTAQPLRIVAEAIGWKGHSPEVLQNMLEHLKKLDELGIRAIE